MAKINDFAELKRRIEAVEAGSTDVVFAIVAPREGDGLLSLQGTRCDLVNALAVACDQKEIRHILYAAVEIDRIHAERVGRRFDKSIDE